MTLEDQHTDLKSLRTVTSRTADWDALAKNCLCFANGAGGRLRNSGVPRSAAGPQKLAAFVRGICASDGVKVTIQRRIARPEVMRLLSEADTQFHLTQRERITLGLLAQCEGMTARELGARLETEGAEALGVWLGRLLDYGLVQTAGKTSGMRYFVAPEWLRGSRLDNKTTLSRITPHRLLALILEDLTRYPDSSSADVNRRIGAEISAKTVKRALDDLIADGKVVYAGERRWRRYRLSDTESKGHEAGNSL